MAILEKNLSKNSVSRAESAIRDAAMCLNDDWHIWMNKKISNFQEGTGESDREIDCILYHPQYGLLVIECKAGIIEKKKGNGCDSEEWIQDRHIMDKPPREQAWSLTHPLHDYFKTVILKPNNAPYRIRIQWALCLSDMESAPGIPPSEIPPRRILFKGDLRMPRFEKRIIEILETPEESYGNLPFKNDELDERAHSILFNFLCGNDELSLPELWAVEESIRLVPTELQQMLMESIVRNPQLNVEGVAGSGKTLLALWEMKRLARDGKRVAMLCYNELLAHSLQNAIKSAGFPDSQVEVREFHNWAQKYARLAKIPYKIPEKDKAQSAAKTEFFDKDSPAIFKAALEKLNDKRKFDALIIDEGQDLADSWVAAALGLLKDSRHGVLRFFCDPNQALYTGRKTLGEKHIRELPVIVLGRGYRTTKNILAWINEVTGRKVPCYADTPSGTKVKEFYYADPAEQITLLDKAVLHLENKGVDKKDILVVSVRSKFRSALKDLSPEKYHWSETGEDLVQDRINVVSAYRAKGLDSNAVILTDVERNQNPQGPGSPHHQAKVIFVGATRAKNTLITLRAK